MTRDPEDPTKEERAEAAQQACRAERAAKAMREYPGYKEIMRDFPDDTAHIDCTVDLITDLLHLVKMKWQADPDYVLRVARMHFDTEQSGK